MSKNNKVALFVVAALAVISLALSPSFLPAEAPADEGVKPPTNSEEAAARYRDLRLALNENRTEVAEGLLAEDGLATLTKNESDGSMEKVATDGKYLATFEQQTELTSDEGTLSAVFVQGTGNCQLQIFSIRSDSSFSGRSVGCAGTISQQTGQLELNGNIVTDLGSSLPFDIIGSVQDGLLVGTIFFEGESIELLP